MKLLQINLWYPYATKGGRICVEQALSRSAVRLIVKIRLLIIFCESEVWHPLQSKKKTMLWACIKMWDLKLLMKTARNTLCSAGCSRPAKYITWELIYSHKSAIWKQFGIWPKVTYCAFYAYFHKTVFSACLHGGGKRIPHSSHITDKKQDKQQQIVGNHTCPGKDKPQA